MNNDELDARLRAASPSHHHTTSTDVISRAVASRRRPVREWFATSTPAARRNLGGTFAAAVALAIVVPAAMPTHAPLFSLSASSHSAAQGSAADYGVGDDSKMMMPFVTYNYIAGPELSNDAGRGLVYRFELDGDVHQRARHIADLLGVEGELVRATYFDEAYPTWVVGPEDGSGANLTVTWSGTGSWWYNNPSAYPEQRCIDPGQPGDAVGDDLTKECSEYEAPITGLNPSESEASAYALELFERLGYTGNMDQVSIYRDEWGTSVTASEIVAGQRIALDWSMYWSGNGEIAYVGGHSARAVEVGEFATISPTDAVERLADWRWFGSAPTDGVPWMSARSYSVGGDAIALEESEPSDEPLPTPTVMDLIITEAVPQMLMVWDSNGSAWLVPGYVMTGDGGWPMAVISLIDGVIELPEPTSIEPAVIDY